MNDMILIVRILTLIRYCEENGYNPSAFSCEALKYPQTRIDNLAVKLQNAGHIEGLITSEDINGANCVKVFWENSNPQVTLSGIEYMSENSAFKNAAGNLKKVAVTTAESVLQIALSRYTGGV